nr:thioredoxin domain-containing protein [Gemmatimonadota bacterium]
DYRETALVNAEFLLRELRRDGRLLRTYKDGRAKIDAFLEDHALLADALIAVYEASGDPRWIHEARGLADTMIERFLDEDEGVFYDTATDSEALVVRPRDLYDNATPSGTSAATLALLRLSALVGEPRYARIATRVLEGMGRLLTEIPAGFGRLLAALDFHLATPREVVVVGTREAEDTRALLNVLARHYLPNTVLAFAEPDSVAGAAELIPLLVGRGMVDGQATAYVCERYACRIPVTDAAGLERELDV